MNIKHILFSLLLLSRAFCKGQAAPSASPASASGIPSPISEVVPYAKLIPTNALTQHGLFIVHKVKDSYYFELPDSILNKPILIVDRIARSSASIVKKMSGFAGDELGEKVITFAKEPNNKICIEALVFADRSKDTSTNGLSAALGKNNVPPILFSFDVKAHGTDSLSSVIDVTDFINGNNDLISGEYSSSVYQPDKSYIVSIKTYPINTEIQTLKTYSSGAGDSTKTLILNTSFLRLPDHPMKERLFDPRVGYFTPFNFDFDKNPQEAKSVLKIMRWRLTPRREDLEKYYLGELVDPQKPIIFYIDPATPKKWVPYLIMGVNDWQNAFERAGFKNAIIAKEVPVNDTSWNMDDARHNVIVYKPSLVANASGPTVMDPRSGEIIESHVNWYHNVMILIHDWYMIQAGAIDPRARKMEFSDELMGQLIRFVSSHEIGHTLGLTHNFGSSSVVPVDSLRNKKWVEAHGHTPSIMDYARFNFVAQPEDHVSEKGIFPRIGDYDVWAIDWGYRLYDPDRDGASEDQWLFDRITDSLKHNPRLYYGAQSYFGVVDARCQSEDLGDDNMKANAYGIKNLKVAMARLPEWSAESTDEFGDVSGNGLRRTYSALLLQFFTFQIHVINNIGLGYYNYITANDKGKVFSLVPKTRQREALAFLNQQVFFKEPTWLIPQSITDEIWQPEKGVITQLVARDVLDLLLNSLRLKHLNDAANLYGEQTYSLTDLLNDLDKSIWQELETGGDVDSFHMSLQQDYVSFITGTIKQFRNDAMSGVLRYHLNMIRDKIRRIIPSIKDKSTIYQYKDIVAQIDGLTSKI